MEAILPRKKFVPVQATPIRGHMRMLLFGPGGGGKSYTACELAYGLTLNGKIGVIDTEFGRIRDYADVFNFIVVTLEDELNAKPFERCFPQRIFEALDALLEFGCDTIILDSLTHVWTSASQYKAHLEKEKRLPGIQASGEAYDTYNQIHDKLTNGKFHFIATCQDTVDKNDVSNKIVAAPKTRHRHDALFGYDFGLFMQDCGMATVVRSQMPEYQGRKINKPTREISKGLLQHKLKKIQAKTTQGENK